MSVICEYSKPAPPELITQPKELFIFLKDGYSFFKANAELLTKRLSDPNKRTTIIIVHPNSPHMEAIAAMDSVKIGRPEIQKSDCIDAVKILHDIRETILKETGFDCAETTTFLGHDSVPTWNGFVTDTKAIINLYTTRPYRGPLMSLNAAKNGPDGMELLYISARTECEEIVREAAQRPAANLWNYDCGIREPAW